MYIQDVSSASTTMGHGNFPSLPHTLSIQDIQLAELPRRIRSVADLAAKCSEARWLELSHEGEDEGSAEPGGILRRMLEKSWVEWSLNGMEWMILELIYIQVYMYVSIFTIFIYRPYARLSYIEMLTHLLAAVQSPRIEWGSIGLQYP